MRIRTVTWGQTVNKGYLGEKTLEATAEVDDMEDPCQVSDDLRAWVLTELEQPVTMRTGRAGAIAMRRRG